MTTWPKDPKLIGNIQWPAPRTESGKQLDRDLRDRDIRENKDFFETLRSIDYAEIERRVSAAMLKPEGCTCNGGEGAKILHLFRDETTIEIDPTCAAHAAMKGFVFFPTRTK
jgi:hypothetical protein